ncbi:hypothetical protein VPH35_128363 [Triticum aestivum]|uniref:Caleosin n=1 Tax=Triticum aestivum TaxID=4565 RepID=A0A3B6SGB2_WHEAT
MDSGFSSSLPLFVKEEPSMADVYSGHELTPLQKHAAFFDQNRDDIIYPSETYQGLHAIGCGVVVSTAGAVFINGLHAPTLLGKSLYTESYQQRAFKFPIYVKTIQQGKHGSDTDVYDTNGRFVPEKFEEIFKKHAHTRPDALTSKELGEMLKANRDPKDFKGRVGAFGEWRLLYFLCKDKEGFLHKETMKAVYDGSVFEKLEREKKQAKEFAKKK